MRRALSGAMIFCLLGSAFSWGADPESPFAKWEKAISAFEEQDKTDPPPKGAVLFVGSSSIRLWDEDKSFPHQKTINRGFGGSEIADSVHFADRIILKYEPKTIVFYAGDNDIAHGKSPEQVHGDFLGFVKVVQTYLPKTKIIFIGIKPSIARWELITSIQKANKLIQNQCEKDDRLVFIDVFPSMVKNGKPRPELFLKDGLHMNEKGYEVWTKLIRPHLPKTDSNQ